MKKSIPRLLEQGPANFTSADPVPLAVVSDAYMRQVDVFNKGRISKLISYNELMSYSTAEVSTLARLWTELMYD